MLFSIFLSGITPLAAWEKPTSLPELVADYRAAMQEKSVEKLNAITYTVGQSDADKKQVASIQQMLFNNNPKEIDEVSIEPLPADFQSIFIVNGKKIELTYPPAGIIKIKYKGTGNGPDSSAQPYVIVGGNYFLDSSKSTDLGWKGPPDKGLCLMVTARGPQDSVQISVKWNASGVEEERVFRSATATVLGQYVESVSVTSKNPDATLTILEGDKQIYCSPPLGGKASIEYKKN